MLTNAFIESGDLRTASLAEIAPGSIFVYRGCICFASEFAQGNRTSRAFVYLTGTDAFELRIIDEAVSVLLLGDISTGHCKVRLQLLSEPRPSQAINGAPRAGTVVIDVNGAHLWIQIGNNAFQTFSLASFAQSKLPENMFQCWWADAWKMQLVLDDIEVQQYARCFEISELSPIPAPLAR